MSEYRVIRTLYVWEGQSTPSFTIHRCATDKRGLIKCGLEAASPEGESLEELRADLQAMLASLERPILESKRGQLVEVKK